MEQKLDAYKTFRSEMDKKIMAGGNLEIKRFFALDKHAYKDALLPAGTKELLGLVASMVLRCDDCIAYHLIRCADLGYSDEELHEAFNVALVVGGSIVIPHLRRAVSMLAEIRDSL